MKKSLLSLLMAFSFYFGFSQSRFYDKIFDPSQILIDTEVIYGQNYSILTGSPLLQSLRLDVFRPNPSDDVCPNTRPLVIFLHGGDYLPKCLNGKATGNRNDPTPVEICQQLAQRGFVAASIDYRLGWNPISVDPDVRRGTYVQALYRAMQDAKTAIRFFKNTYAVGGNPYGIDTSRIILMGDGTGGDIALLTAFLDDYNQLLIPKFVNSVSGEPYIDTVIMGGINGEAGTQNVDTFSGYGSGFSMVVSLGGTIVDTAIIDQNDPAVVSFHCIRDPFAPYNDGTLIIPTTNEDVIDLFGPGVFMVTANEKNLNNSFASFSDPITTIARSRYNQTIPYIFPAPQDQINTYGDEGLFPFILPLGASIFQNQASPWQYWEIPNPPASCTDTGGNPVCPDCLNSNPDMSETKALSYIDTIMGYFIPRAVLGADLADLIYCTSSLSKISGEVYYDNNQNGIKDGVDFTLSNQSVSLQPLYLIALSSLGNYAFGVNLPGNYSLSWVVDSQYQLTTPSPISIVVDTAINLYENNNFGIYPTVQLSDAIATITPNTIPRPGFDICYWISYQNTGTTILDGSVTFSHDSVLTFLNSTVAPSSQANDTYTFTFADLVPGETRKVRVCFNVPADINLFGQLLCADASIDFGQTTRTIDHDPFICDTIQGSYDPNDKTHLGYNDVTGFEPGSTIDYRIRFQNTGTDTAFTVVVRDTLDALLDASTFRVLSTSHDYSVTIESGKYVVFRFENILLPDSNVNEPGSHGHIIYRISPKGNAEILDVIKNRAGIYFDFNPVVLTNTAESRIDTITGVRDLKRVASFASRVIPNPTEGKSLIIWDSYIEAANLVITDALGRTVWTIKEVRGAQIEIDISTYPSGIYLYRLTDGRGNSSSGKVVVR